MSQLIRTDTLYTEVSEATGNNNYPLKWIVLSLFIWFINVERYKNNFINAKTDCS